jgi:hypothetical protein
MRRKLLTACTVAGMLSVPMSEASGVNLLVNSDAEAGNISGWTNPGLVCWATPGGSFRAFRQGDLDALPHEPHGGNYAFHAWSRSEALQNSMYQDVDVSSRSPTKETTGPTAFAPTRGETIGRSSAGRWRVRDAPGWGW